jgi:hypothetical protein
VRYAHGPEQTARLGAEDAARAVRLDDEHPGEPREHVDITTRNGRGGVQQARTRGRSRPPQCTPAKAVSLGRDIDGDGDPDEIEIHLQVAEEISTSTPARGGVWRSYSKMTWSARPRIEGGTVNPSVLAVVRLMVNSNRAGSIGRSCGRAPLRILSTKTAAWR